MKNQSMLWQRLKIIVDGVDTYVAKELQRKHGIGLTEYRALSLLIDAHDSELRMQELAKLLGLNQSSVTRLVERLERDNYTIRDLCPKDKRGVYSVITGRGREIQEQVEQHYIHYLNEALDDACKLEENQKIVGCIRQIIHR